MLQTVCRGVVKGKKVVLEGETDLPEGTEVLVTPVDMLRGSPQAVLAAMEAPPYLKPQDIEELMKQIQASKRPMRFTNPLTSKQ